MCFLMEGDEDEGGAKVQTKRHHTWLIPRHTLWLVLGLSITFFFLGIVLMAIGGGGGISVLSVIGGILFGFGILGVIICLLVCLYAYFVYGTKDQAMQTETNFPSTIEMTDGPEYASISRRSALKSADSTLRKNGTLGPKKVTMAPDVGPNAQNSSNAIHSGNTLHGGSNSVISGRQNDAPVSPAYLSSRGMSRFYAGDGSVGTASSVRSSTSDIGTGGIRILPVDQPFPTVSDPVHTPSTPSAIYSRGGSSASSLVDGFSFPPADHHSMGHDSGFTDTSQRSLRHVSISPAPSGSESQYSTLRSIPVTHIISESQMQQMKQQRAVQQNPQSSMKQPPSPVSPQIITADTNSQVRATNNHKTQSAKGYRQQVLSADLQDFDYDIPEDRTSLLSQKSGQSSTPSYHEQQMNYQRQKRHQEFHASQQAASNSLRREDNRNTYKQHQHHEQYQNQSQPQSFVTIQEDQIPENQPLVYPSVRRPMTFEQISSSKMSMYDNE